VIGPFIFAAWAAAAADTLVVGVLSDPVSLEPHEATELVSGAIVANVCDPLVRQRADRTGVTPALAASWATRDNRSWTIVLRSGVRFHDGRPLDADALVANIDSLRRKRAFGGHAERLGPRVVALTLERPNAALLATLSQPYFGLQSPAALDSGRPVGSGPYRLAEVRPGLVELEANPEHWAGAPRLRHLLFQRFADPEALLAALRGGQADVTVALGPDWLQRARQLPELQVDERVALDVAFLSLNNLRPPLDDRRVRQAIARSLDRDAIVREILAGHGEPARNPLPPALSGYAQRTRTLVVDRRAARRLLTDAGLPNGFEARLMAVDAPRPYMPRPLPLARLLRAQLAEVGIRLTLDVVPSWSRYLERGSRGEYEMAVLGWQADTTDPNDTLTALVGSESIGTTNRSRYASVAMDDLLKRGRMSRQPAERETIYAEAQELFQADMPWVPLYHASALTVRRRELRGIETGPTGILRFHSAYREKQTTDCGRASGCVTTPAP
jgi:peptide/nickel transport system substrate-binding protein